MRTLVLAAVVLAVGACTAATSSSGPRTAVPDTNEGANVLTIEIVVDGTEMTCVTYSDKGISCDWVGWHERRGVTPSP